MSNLTFYIGGVLSFFALLLKSYFSGKTAARNEKLNEEAKGVKTARKIENENRGLTRKQLINKL